MEGREWKAWRAIFNPGFAPANLMGLVPSVVEEVEVFARVLGGWADRREVVVLEEVATRVTVDVIGRVVLDTKVCGRFLLVLRSWCLGRGCVFSARWVEVDGGEHAVRFPNVGQRTRVCFEEPGALELAGRHVCSDQEPESGAAGGVLVEHEDNESVPGERTRETVRVQG